jgi:hypothetical protein
MRATGPPKAGKDAGPGQSQPRGSNLQRLIALPGRITLVIVRDPAVWPQTVIRMLTPERAIVPVLDRRIPLGLDEHAFPAQVVATLLPDNG